MNIDVDDLMMCTLSVWNSTQKEFLRKTGAPLDSYYTRYFALLRKPQDYHKIMNTVLTAPHSPAEFATIFQQVLNTVHTTHHFKEQVGLSGYSSNEKINEAEYEVFLSNALLATEHAPLSQVMPLVFSTTTWEAANTQMKKVLKKESESLEDSFKGIDLDLWESVFGLTDLEYKWKIYNKNTTAVSDVLSNAIMCAALEKYNDPKVVKDIASFSLNSLGPKWRTRDYVKKIWEGVFVMANWDRESLERCLRNVLKSDPNPGNCFFAKKKP